MHLKKKVRVFVKESWKYEERARRLSLTVFQPQTKRGRQRIYRKSKISLGFDWWNRNTRYAKKMHINFFCKKNNKSNKLQCLVVCFLENDEDLMKSLNSDTSQKIFASMLYEEWKWYMTNARPSADWRGSPSLNKLRYRQRTHTKPTHVFGPAPYYVYLYFYFIFVWF